MKEIFRRVRTVKKFNAAGKIIEKILNEKKRFFFLIIILPSIVKELKLIVAMSYTTYGNPS